MIDEHGKEQGGGGAGASDVTDFEGIEPSMAGLAGTAGAEVRGGSANSGRGFMDVGGVEDERDEGWGDMYGVQRGDADGEPFTEPPLMPERGGAIDADGENGIGAAAERRGDGADDAGAGSMGGVPHAVVDLSGIDGLLQQPRPTAASTRDGGGIGGTLGNDAEAEAAVGEAADGQKVGQRDNHADPNGDPIGDPIGPGSTVDGGDVLGDPSRSQRPQWDHAQAAAELAAIRAAREQRLRAGQGGGQGGGGAMPNMLGEVAASPAAADEDRGESGQQLSELSDFEIMERMARGAT